MKLKTLKDFEEMQVHDDGTPCLLVLPLLRQEAIKWYHRSDDNKHKFIREFFNITEDELQDEARE